MPNYIIKSAHLSAHTKSWKKGDVVSEEDLVGNGGKLEEWLKEEYIAVTDQGNANAPAATPATPAEPLSPEHEELLKPRTSSRAMTKEEYIAARDKESKAAAPTPPAPRPFTPPTPIPPAPATGN